MNMRIMIKNIYCVNTWGRSSILDTRVCYSELIAPFGNPREGWQWKARKRGGTTSADLQRTARPAGTKGRAHTFPIAHVARISELPSLINCSIPMTKTLLLPFLLLFVTSQRSAAQTNASIEFDGITRNHIVYVPTSYQPGQSLPLVFVLHGFTQSAEAIMNVSGFNAVAEANNFIVAYPNGVGNAWNTNSGFPGGSTANDPGYINALADVLITEFGIDSNRVYSCGFSAGGFMSHRLACESTRCFAAIASVSGTMSNTASDACAPQNSTPVMQIHGTSDFVVSYNGSIFSGVGAEDVIDRWVDLLACPTEAVITLLPDLDPNDNSTVERRDYSPCDGNAAVVLLKVNGGGHQWPGSTAALGGIGNINRDIVASDEIWDFFQGYSCAGITTGVQSVQQPLLAAWPNPTRDVITLTGLAKPTAYDLFDGAGRAVLSGSVNVPNTVLDLHVLDAGCYLLKLADGSGRTLRLMKY